MKHIRNSVKGVFILQHTGAPNKSVTDFNEPILIGSLCIDSTNGGLYVLKSDNWEKLASFAGEDGYIKLSGTESGQPVTGDVEFSNTKSLFSGIAKMTFLDNSIVMTSGTTNKQYKFQLDANIIRKLNSEVSISGISTDNFVNHTDTGLVLDNSTRNTLFGYNKSITMENSTITLCNSIQELVNYVDSSINILNANLKNATLTNIHRNLVMGELDGNITVMNDITDSIMTISTTNANINKISNSVVSGTYTSVELTEIYHSFLSITESIKKIEKVFNSDIRIKNSDLEISNLESVMILSDIFGGVADTITNSLLFGDFDNGMLSNIKYSILFGKINDSTITGDYNIVTNEHTNLELVGNSNTLFSKSNDLHLDGDNNTIINSVISGTNSINNTTIINSEIDISYLADDVVLINSKNINTNGFQNNTFINVSDIVASTSGVVYLPDNIVVGKGMIVSPSTDNIYHMPTNSGTLATIDDVTVGTTILNASKTIWVDPVNGDDSDTNFVKTMTRARTIVGSDTIGWSIVCLSGELTEVIDLGIVEYPNQLAGEGLTWVFSPRFTANLSSNETLFKFGNRDINGSVFWQHGCSIIGEYATLNNTGTSSVFDLNGLYTSPGVSFVEIHIKLLNITSSLAPIFVEKFDVLKNSYLGNFVFDVLDVLGDFNIKTICKQIQKSHIKIHQITCPNKFSIEYNPLRVFSNGQTFMECIIDVYKILSPEVLINLGIGLKYDIYIQFIVYTTVDTIVNAHANYNSIKILNIVSNSIIFEPLPQAAWRYNTGKKFSGAYQEYVIVSPNDITFYQGFDFDVIYNLEFSCLGNGTVKILNNPNAWSPVDNNRTVNLTLPKPISNLVIENCNVNIITDSLIGHICASNASVERSINITSPIIVDNGILDLSFICLYDKYILNIENTISIGNSITTPLVYPQFGVELFGESQIIMNGGSIETSVVDPLFYLIKNSKTSDSSDILVKHNGGKLNDMSLKTETVYGIYRINILSVSAVSFDVFLYGVKYEVVETDIATYNTIELLTNRINELVNAIPTDSEISSNIDTSSSIIITGNVICGFSCISFVNCELLSYAYETKIFNIVDYISGDFQQTLANGYFIYESRKVDDDYELYVMADKSGRLHIRLDYWLFETGTRTIELLPISDYFLKLMVFVDTRNSTKPTSGFMGSTNTFNKFRDNVTPLAYSNTTWTNSEYITYNDSSGENSPLYKQSPNGMIDLSTDPLTFEIDTTYMTPSVAPYTIMKTLIVEGYITPKN